MYIKIRQKLQSVPLLKFESDNILTSKDHFSDNRIYQRESNNIDVNKNSKHQDYIDPLILLSARCSIKGNLKSLISSPVDKNARRSSQFLKDRNQKQSQNNLLQSTILGSLVETTMDQNNKNTFNLKMIKTNYYKSSFIKLNVDQPQTNTKVKQKFVLSNGRQINIIKKSLHESKQTVAYPSYINNESLKQQQPNTSTILIPNALNRSKNKILDSPTKTQFSLSQYTRPVFTRKTTNLINWNLRSQPKQHEIDYDSQQSPIMCRNSSQYSQTELMDLKMHYWRKDEDYSQTQRQELKQKQELCSQFLTRRPKQESKVNSINPISKKKLLSGFIKKYVVEDQKEDNNLTFFSIKGWE